MGCRVTSFPQEEAGLDEVSYRKEMERLVAFCLQHREELGGPTCDRGDSQYSRTRTFRDFANEFVYGKSAPEILSGSLPSR